MTGNLVNRLKACIFSDRLNYKQVTFFLDVLKFMQKIIMWGPHYTVNRLIHENVR